MIPVERNYETHDQELLTIIKSFKHWWHYLEGSDQSIAVLLDHTNLWYFMTMKELSRRQARGAECLVAFDFEIQYCKGAMNPADGLSWRPDYKKTLEGEQELLLPTLQQKLHCGIAIQRNGSRITAMLHLTRARMGVVVDLLQNPKGGVQGNGPLRRVDTTEATLDQAVVSTVMQKRKAPPPQETIGEGTTKPTPKTGKDREAIGSIDKMSTSLW